MTHYTADMLSRMSMVDIENVFEAFGADLVRFIASADSFPHCDPVDVNERRRDGVYEGCLIAVSMLNEYTRETVINLCEAFGIAQPSSDVVIVSIYDDARVTNLYTWRVMVYSPDEFKAECSRYRDNKRVIMIKELDKSAALASKAFGNLDSFIVESEVVKDHGLETI